jgi:poly-gamma-glutamate capsule biosynthesis protein CapA/YwtB (metallophosphatase superfamily)
MGWRRIRRSTIPAVAAAVAVAAAFAVGPLPPVAAPTPVRAVAAPRAIAARADSFTVVATGDVLIHQDGPLVRGAAAAGKANGTGYDFRGVFRAVAPTIRAADLAVCHLETPVADPRGPFTGYPTFDVQPQIVDALQDAGYDICSTASNHAMDAGFDGLVRTLNTLDAHGIGHTGTSRTQPERQTPHLVDVHGVRVAHIAWTFGLNGIKEPAGKPWAVNVFDPRPPTVGDMLAEAAAARRAGADVVIASVHCCTEYQADPTPAQLRIAAALLGSPDVDLVIGHHAHVVQPLERINGKWVAYGLGNHVAQQAGPATNDSVITRFTFARGSDGHFTTTAAEAIPTRIRQADDAVVVAPTPPGDASYQRVVQVLERRGAAGAGLRIVGR